MAFCSVMNTGSQLTVGWPSITANLSFLRHSNTGPMALTAIGCEAFHPPKHILIVHCYRTNFTLCQKGLVLAPVSLRPTPTDHRFIQGNMTTGGPRECDILP